MLDLPSPYEAQHAHMIAVLKTLGSYLQDLRWAILYCSGITNRWRILTDFTLARVGRLVPGLLNGRESQITLADGTALHYRLNRCDLWTLHEIWVRREYELAIGMRPALAVDIGANIGLTSLWFARTYGADVIAVEPSAANTSVLRANFESNGIRGQVVEAAAGAVDGRASFLQGPGATCGRVDFKAEFDAAGLAAEHAVDVTVISMSTLLHKLPTGRRVDLLKIDIEGGEEELLKGDTSWLERVDYIVIELHPGLIDYDRAIGTLHDAGFCREFRRSSGRDTVEGFRRTDSVIQSSDS